jgi:hypothetical protein
MAAHSVAADERAAHAKTLVANTQDTVTFASDFEEVDIHSDGVAAIYFTVGVGGAGQPDATVAGAKTYLMPAGVVSRRRVRVPGSGNTVVKLISAGVPTYSVAQVQV